MWICYLYRSVPLGSQLLIVHFKFRGSIDLLCCCILILWFEIVLSSPSYEYVVKLADITIYASEAPLDLKEEQQQRKKKRFVYFWYFPALIFLKFIHGLKRVFYEVKYDVFSRRSERPPLPQTNRPVGLLWLRLGWMTRMWNYSHCWID